MRALIIALFSIHQLTACATSAPDTVTFINSERQLPGPCEHLGYLTHDKLGWSMPGAQQRAQASLAEEADKRGADYIAINQQRSVNHLILSEYSLGGNIYRCR